MLIIFLSIVVFPVPEGAEMMKRLPLFKELAFEIARLLGVFHMMD